MFLRRIHVFINYFLNLKFQLVNKLILKVALQKYPKNEYFPNNVKGM